MGARLIYGFLMLLFVYSCKQKEKVYPPVFIKEIVYNPSFLYSGELYLGSPIYFDTVDIPAHAVISWDFGDGTTSDEISPTHKFYNHGRHFVKMVTSGDTEIVVSKELKISLVPRAFTRERRWIGQYVNGPMQGSDPPNVTNIDEYASVQMVSDTICRFYQSSYLRYRSLIDSNVLLFEFNIPHATLHYYIAQDSFVYKLYYTYGAGPAGGIVSVNMHSD